MDFTLTLKATGLPAPLARWTTTTIPVVGDQITVDDDQTRWVIRRRLWSGPLAVTLFLDQVA